MDDPTRVCVCLSRDNRAEPQVQLARDAEPRASCTFAVSTPRLSWDEDEDEDEDEDDDEERMNRRIDEFLRLLSNDNSSYV